MVVVFPLFPSTKLIHQRGRKHDCSGLFECNLSLEHKIQTYRNIKLTMQGLHPENLVTSHNLAEQDLVSSPASDVGDAIIHHILHFSYRVPAASQVGTWGTLRRPQGFYGCF